MKISLQLLMLLGVGYALSISSCRDCEDPTNPECSNYDPCLITTDTKTSANFKMYECIKCGWADTLMRATNTVFGGYVVFEAEQFGADIISYEWKIGTDSRVFTERLFRLDFSGYQGEVEVRLVVQKEVNTDCFPNDDGIDTVTRVLKVLGASTENMFRNKEYEGYNTDEPDSIFTVSFRPSDPTEPLSYSTLNNLPKGCVRPSNWQIGLTIGYNAFIINNSDGVYFYDCGHIIGYGDILPDRKTIVINYKLTDNALTPFDKRISKTFIGTLKE